MEIKFNSGKYSANNHYIPTPLTNAEHKKVDKRNDEIKAIKALADNSQIFIKINRGIYAGSIFPIQVQKNGRWYPGFWFDVHRARASYNLTYEERRQNRKLEFCPFVQFSFTFSDTIHVAGNEIQGSALNSRDITQHISILLNYTGGEVYKCSIAVDFTDRLNQKISVGDLVVAATDYNLLDICTVIGSKDRDRILLKRIEDDRVISMKLSNNSSHAIMKMENSLQDIALMMKLTKA